MSHPDGKSEGRAIGEKVGVDLLCGIISSVPVGGVRTWCYWLRGSPVRWLLKTHRRPLGFHPLLGCCHPAAVGSPSFVVLSPEMSLSLSVVLLLQTPIVCWMSHRRQLPEFPQARVNSLPFAKRRSC